MKIVSVATCSARPASAMLTPVCASLSVVEEMAPPTA